MRRYVELGFFSVLLLCSSAYAGKNKAKKVSLATSQEQVGKKRLRRYVEALESDEEADENEEVQEEACDEAQSAAASDEESSSDESSSSSESSSSEGPEIPAVGPAMSKDDFLKKHESIKEKARQLCALRGQRNILMMVLKAECRPKKHKYIPEILSHGKLHRLHEKMVDIEHNGSQEVPIATVRDYKKLESRLERDIAKCQAEISIVEKIMEINRKKKEDEQPGFMGMFS